jgi:hypothetical protein
MNDEEFLRLFHESALSGEEFVTEVIFVSPGSFSQNIRGLRLTR